MLKSLISNRYVYALLLCGAIFTVLGTHQSHAIKCKCVSAGTVDQTQGCWAETNNGSGVERAVANCVTIVAVQANPPCGVQPVPAPGAAAYCNPLKEASVDLWFKVPTLGDLIGNIIRLIFFIAGLYALILLLLGGFEWVSSGGDDKKLEGARGKIINAVIGLVVMVAVLTLVIVLEQVVFGGKVCLGISCPINMGDLRIIK